MLNHYILLALVIGWGASMAGAGYVSYNAGKDRCEAQAARDERVTKLAGEAAAISTAQAIARIEIKNTTVRQATERIVREQKVFTECRSGPELVRLLNSLPAIAASGPVPAGDRSVQAAPVAPE